jgi:uncharacterized protein YjbI with pentapeptide repeats
MTSDHEGLDVGPAGAIGPSSLPEAPGHTWRQLIAGEAQRQHQAWLAGQRGSKRLYVKGRDLRQAVAVGHDFRLASFDSCDLSQARLALAAMVGVEMERCRVEQADLEAVKLDRARARDSSFAGSHMVLCSFEGAWLDRPSFRDAGAARSRWADAVVALGDLRQASLERATLTRATFVACDLRGARLAGADIAEASFDRCDLREADLSGCAVAAARFRDCVGHAGEPPAPRPGRERLLAFAKRFDDAKVDPRDWNAESALSEDEMGARGAAWAAWTSLPSLLSRRGHRGYDAELGRLGPARSGELARDGFEQLLPRFRARVAERAREADSTAEDLMLCDAVEWAALAIAGAPNLASVLAHLTRYLRVYELVHPEGLTSAVGGALYYTSGGKAPRPAPPDTRVRQLFPDEVDWIAANLAPGTPPDLVASTIEHDTRGHWRVVTTSPLLLRHANGAFARVHCDASGIVSHELVVGDAALALEASTKA